MIFDEHCLAQGFFVDRLVRNGEAALFAARTKIFHEVGNEFLSFPGLAA